MNLQPILPADKHGQTVTCYHCQQRKPLAECKADLDGPAFKAYYCRACQNSVIAQQPT